jgi:hypothetical protein
MQMQMQVETGNLMPVKYIQRFEYIQVSKMAVKLLTKITALFLFGSAVVGSLCYFYSTNRAMDVPPEIMAAYTAAQKGTVTMAKQKELLQKAKDEDCRPISTLSNLLSVKPAEIKFSRVEIARHIQIEGFAGDPVVINQYLAQIIALQAFSNANVEKISGNGNFKTFVIKADQK